MYSSNIHVLGLQTSVLFPYPCTSVLGLVGGLLITEKLTTYILITDILVTDKLITDKLITKIYKLIT